MGLFRSDQNFKTDGIDSQSKSKIVAEHGLLMVLPWSPDHIGGVNEVVINLFKWFRSNTGTSQRLLVNSYNDLRLTRAETQTLGAVDWLYVPAPGNSRRPLMSIASFALRVPASLFQLVAYLRRERVGVINFHYPTLAVVTLWLAKNFANRSIRLILSFHGSDLQGIENSNWFHRWMWRCIARRCDGIVACSHALETGVRRIFPGISLPVHVIHNGINSNDCRQIARSEPLPEELRGRRYIVNAATFEKKKGQDVLITSFQSLAKHHPDLCLVIVGRSGPAFGDIKLLSRKSEFAERILIYPDMPHDTTLSVIAGAELLVQPSRQEPFGLVLLEAACLDVPIVASHVGGIPEVITDRSTGLLVKPDDPEALGQAIGRLLEDKTLAAGCARNLRRTVERKFTWNRAAWRYAALFDHDDIAD